MVNGQIAVQTSSQPIHGHTPTLHFASSPRNHASFRQAGKQLPHRRIQPILGGDSLVATRYPSNTSMADFIEKCQDLVDSLEKQYPIGNDQFFLAEECPRKALENLNMALHIQTIVGVRLMNMRLPNVRRVLTALAAEGPGFSKEDGGIRFRFISRKFSE
jgi:hypothetical protein